MSRAAQNQALTYWVSERASLKRAIEGFSAGVRRLDLRYRITRARFLAECARDTFPNSAQAEHNVKLILTALIDLDGRLRYDDQGRAPTNERGVPRTA